MQRIPQATETQYVQEPHLKPSPVASRIARLLAMILLMSALTCQMCSAQASPVGVQANTVMKTRGAAQVEALLREFLSKVNEPSMHDRFWADDLVYVGAGGTVRTKAEIMEDVTHTHVQTFSAPTVSEVTRQMEEAAKNVDPAKKDDASYDAEDVKVRQFGDVVVLNFRLVAKSEGKTSYYRNSGSFVERNGKWQAVSWQATKEPEK